MSAMSEGVQALADKFRTCPTTGLKVHRDADNLIKANAVVATVALLIGGSAAILILLTRWQAVHLRFWTSPRRCCSIRESQRRSWDGWRLG